MRNALLLLLALALASCVNFSGKLDSVGRNDAVFNPARSVTARYRVGEKTYVPVTIRYCKASERIYDDVFPCYGGAYRTGGSEPQGREVTLWTEYKGTEDARTEKYHNQHLPLLTAEELDLAHARITQGIPLAQAQLIRSTDDLDAAHYWMAEPQDARKPRPESLAFAVDVAPERSFGNELRRPLVYALKLIDIPLSFFSVAAELLPAAVEVLLPE